MGRQDYETETLIAHSLRGEGFDASEDGTERGTPLVPVAIQERAISENPDSGPDGAGFRTDGMAYTLEARVVPQAVAFSIMPMNSGKDYKARETDVAQPVMAGGPVGGNQGGDFVVGFQASQSGFREVETHATLDANMGSRRHNGVAIGSAVRRLTPRECERLQGFPDDYTLIPYRNRLAADGPRYKALGNSMAVPVMRWIGERIQQVENLNSARASHAALIEPARTSPEGRLTPNKPCGSPAIPQALNDVSSDHAECGRAASAGSSFHEMLTSAEAHG